MLWVVPGTGWRHWPTLYALDSGPMCQVAEAFGELPRVLDWSGANWRRARRQAARDLAQAIQRHEFGAGERLNLVGFSHGGNVAVEATHALGVEVENLVTIATPVVRFYGEPEGVRNHIHIYNPLDGIQRWGGEALWLPFSGRLGLAGRAWPGAVNMEVRIRGGLKQRHGDLLWSEVLWSGVRGLLVR